MRDFISNWTHGEDWKTWIAHTTIASIIVIVGTLILSGFYGFDIALLVSSAVAVGFYFLRELDQMLYKIVGRQPLKLFDSIMDVAVPAVVILPLAWIIKELV